MRHSLAVSTLAVMSLWPPAPHAATVSGAGSPSQSDAASLVVVGAPDRRLPACVDCHGPTLMGGGPGIPPLAGKDAGYLARQLRAFRSGRRDGGPLGLMGRIAQRLPLDDIGAVADYIAAVAPGEPPRAPPAGSHRAGGYRPPSNRHGFAPPPESALPQAGPYAAAVRLGERIFDDTPRYAPDYVGNALSCRNCHLDRGRSAGSAPMWAAVVRYPRYRSKSGKVMTLEMRLQACFRYSENGTAPPPDGPVMVALTTYLHWLATGLPMGVQPPAGGLRRLAAPPAAPDPGRGRVIYETDCRLCHGRDGQGRVTAGLRVFPPLWGPASYNWGAGMHRMDKAAAFIAANMPFSRGGMLSVQQAWDVAAYIDSRPRPQDPRFNGSVELTRRAYHGRSAVDAYGAVVDGMRLGAPGTLASWAKRHAGVAVTAPPDPR